MQSAAAIAGSFECGRYDMVFELLTQSHKCRDGTKIISDTLNSTEFYR